MKGIIKRPIITEKATQLSEALNQYSFVVDKKATKEEIKREIEQLYGVKVVKVRTHIMPKKPKYRYTRTAIIRGAKPSFKKAIVTLAEGNEIDFYKNI